MRPRHPRPKDRHLMDLFEQYTSRDKLQTVRWTDQVRPNRAKHSFEGKSKMAHKVMIEVHGNKKRRETTWLPLTRGARHGKPRQGQDTRLCRDATNKAIKAIRGVIKSRDKFKSQPSSLQEYRCRCRCKTTCPYKQLNYINCTCKAVKDCRCNIKAGCVYLLGCKTNTTKKYIGEAINPFDRFHKHMKNAFSDFARTGKDSSKLERAIRLSGPNAHKKWFMVILQDIPRDEGESDDTWKQRRKDAERIRVKYVHVVCTLFHES